MLDTIHFSAVRGALSQAGNPITCLTVLRVNGGVKMYESVSEITDRVLGIHQYHAVTVDGRDGLDWLQRARHWLLRSPGFDHAAYMVVNDCILRVILNR